MVNHSKSKWTFWKITAVFMIFCNILLLIFLLTKFNLLDDIRNAANDLDSPIVFSLTLLQTFIALGAFGGFWLIRNSAESKASEVAREVASDRMERFIQQQRDITQQSSSHSNNQTLHIEAEIPTAVSEADRNE